MTEPVTSAMGMLFWDQARPVERMGDAEYLAHSRRWWARSWASLNRGERRRLRSNRELLAARTAWLSERINRAAEHVFRIAAIAVEENVFLRVLGPTPFEGTGDVIGADGPIAFEEDEA